LFFLLKDLFKDYFILHRGLRNEKAVWKYIQTAV